MRTPVIVDAIRLASDKGKMGGALSGTAPDLDAGPCPEGDRRAQRSRPRAGGRSARAEAALARTQDHVFEREALNQGTLATAEASKAKLWATEMQVRVTSRCLQLFGGYGYMNEYPIGRAYRDCRVQTIYGGTSQIMKEILGRDIAGRYPKEASR